jgi:hypothetical protein
LAKTLGFQMDSFREPLPRPSLWHHIDVYPTFDVWGYSVQSDRRRPGFTVIENVSSKGFRSAVREWLPGGALMPSVAVRVTTDALYEPGRRYWITDVNLTTGEVRQSRQNADELGRLRFSIDGDLHEVGVSAAAEPIVAASGWRVVGASWATAGKPVRLAIALLNKGAAEARNIRATVDSPNPGVTFERRELMLARLAPGEASEPSQEVVLTVSDPDREVVKLLVRVQGVEFPLEIPLFRNAAEIPDFVIADGARLPVWERAINREERVVGTGNADGIAGRGETVAIAVRDGEAFRLVEAFTSHPCVDSSRRVSDPWGRYDNVGASAKYSFLLLSSSCPEGAEIPLFVRYQLPDKPDHVLKEGVVRLPVQGRDQTPPQAEWAAVREWNLLEIKIFDGGKVRSALATLRKGDAVIDVRVNDEGRDGDLSAGDRIFSGLVPNPAPGVYSLTLAAEDEFGNSTEMPVEGDFRFVLPERAPVAP